MEPDLHLVEPGGVGGREVERQSPSAAHPFLDLVMLVHTEVVEDHVQLFARMLAIQGLQEVQERGVVVFVDASPGDLARMHGKGGQQTGGAMPLVRRCQPARMGNSGWVRSRAWIWDFSSTHKTRAWLGGSRYSPKMAACLASNSGSGLRPHQYSVLWGLR